MGEVVNDQSIVEVKYAGFWSRLFAQILDGIIVVTLYIVIGLAAIALAALGMASSFTWSKFLNPESLPFSTKLLLMPFALIAMLITVAYEPFFIGKYSHTPGRKAMSIRVIRADGGRVGYGGAIVRTLCKWLLYSFPIVGTPLMLVSAGFVVFQARKQSLHDLACKTVTISK